MAVGPVELGEVGEHASVGDGGSRRVGLLERPLDPAVEDGLVPRRELVGEQPPEPPAARRRLDLGGVGDGLVVGAPLHDRGVVAERAHRLPSLAHGLSPDLTGVAPLQREVLQHQDAELVRGAVELVIGDVRLHAQHVEAGLGGELDVTAHLLGIGVGQARPGGQHVGPLEEQPLAVDRAHPVVPGDLTQAGAAGPAIAGHAVDEQLDVDLGERLGAEGAGPPELGPIEVERPLDLVDAGGEGMLGLAHRHAVGRGAQADGAGGVTVDAGVEADMGPALVGITAQHPEAIELGRPGVVQEHRTPESARVPVAVDRLGVLEQPGDVAPPPRALLVVAGHLDREHVVVPEPGEGGDVEAVGEEVALGVAEVGPVEPHVRLVEDPVERDPAPPARLRRRAVESAAVQDRDRRWWPARAPRASGRAR